MGDLIRVRFETPEPDVWLDKLELANRLGCTSRHVEKLTAEGLPSRLEGVRRLYREPEAREWLTRRNEASRGGAHA